jgi:dTDP-4-dehydrorhamnose reductase
MTEWVVTGAGGMLGREVVTLLADEKVHALTHADLDIGDPSCVQAAVRGADVVVNAAAWTDVDAAEAAETAVFRVNADGPRLLAAACRRTGARLLHVSTDYVFSGHARRPYREDAEPCPRTAYGRSKAAGEHAVLTGHPEGSYVVRTAWLYGAHGRNFVRTMMGLAAEQENIDVVDDQRGQPTWARDLAERLISLAGSDAAPGVYHVSGAGEATWYDLACAVFAAVGADPARVRPTTTQLFPRPAERPSYSVLAHDRWLAAGLEPMPPWEVSLSRALASMGTTPEGMALWT